MQKLFLIFVFLCSNILVQAQPPVKNQTAAMKQEIVNLKKEIKDLENEIQLLEKTDPEEAILLKKELTTLKKMLSMLGGAAAPVKEPVKPAPGKNSQATPAKSPLVSITLKQPLTIPTTAQAKDRLLWYSGKKLNDSTLVTVKGLLVQYSHKRRMVIVQPPKKNDPFGKTVTEIVNNEKRKNELAGRFAAMQNGFLYYPLLVTTMAMYDDLASGFTNVVKNTIELPVLPALISVNDSFTPDTYTLTMGRGPSMPPVFIDTVPGKKNRPAADYLNQQMEQQYELVKKVFKELPPVSEFTAPPPRNLGLCATCDTSILSRERRQDSTWIEKYHGQENRIASLILGLEREKGLLGVNDNNSYIELLKPIFKRIEEKDKILLEKYGNDARYTQVISMVVLGHERERQLIGIDGNESPSLIQPLMHKASDAYKKYFKEQVEAKNHDFVLNLPFHLSVLRQKALLGVEEDKATLNDLINTMMEYNRFALTTGIDFIYEQWNDDNEIELKATGTLESVEKKYTMLIFDSCTYRLMPYTTDISNQNLDKVTMPMTVKSGAKTMRDDEGKLVTYRYSGSESFPLQFPEFRINFCNAAKPDTAFMTGFVGNEETAQQFTTAITQINKNYKTDILLFANYVFYAGEIDEEGTIDLGNEILESLTNLQNQVPATTAMGKLKQQYEGKKQMENHRQDMINKLANNKTAFLFNANNMSTVFTDKYNDFKRKIEYNTELKKGQVHLRILHEPVR